MDFFEAQERARRHTGWLIVLFSLAVCGTVLGVYAGTKVMVHAAWHRPFDQLPAQFWDRDLLWEVAAVTMAVILAGSIYKTHAIGASADTLALSLGGRLVNPDTRDAFERRLLNVVEEMAIASGVPVPSVHVLPAEPGINAFAVGLDPSRSAIAVTEGCLKLLSRDELQGVVAHEFSHLLNGDSRINLRLLGLVHGILVIGLFGSALLRSSFEGKKRKLDLGGLISVLFVGVALYLVGSIGVFFTRLIKAAVCRERELLADASGVQFTRNPEGLAGALKKIGGLDQGSRLRAARAEEASHFYFSEGIKHFGGLMSTHPPLLERIRRLDPQFDGDLSRGQLAPVTLEEETPGVASAIPGARSFAAHPRAITSAVGALGDQHIAYAQSLVARIPPALRDGVREPWGARALVLALLLDQNPGIRAAQLNALRTPADGRLADEVARVSAVAQACPPEARLPIVDLALPALRRLSRPQYDEFAAAVDRFIRADSRIGLFEYTLQRVLFRHLTAHFEPRREARVTGPEMKVDDALSLVLSILAHAGGTDPAAVTRAFNAARAELSRGRFQPTLLPRTQCDLRGLDRALERLGDTAPRLRAEILGACAAAVATDGRVTIAEGEMLRAIADTLGCPVPPLLAGQDLAARPAARAG